MVIVVHGGCWTKGFANLRNTAPLATALTKLWNIEYRQLGDDGAGWPGTFTDWAAATDQLRTLATTQPLDLSRVAVVGHSAGASGALWIASRPNIAADSAIAHPIRCRSLPRWVSTGPAISLRSSALTRRSAVCRSSLR